MDVLNKWGEEMRLIDADALECDTEWSDYHDGFTSYSQMEIDTAPTIDAVSVVHGEWKKDDDGEFICSNCNNGYKDQPTLVGRPMFEYCPICGAKMDGERKESE